MSGKFYMIEQRIVEQIICIFLFLRKVRFVMNRKDIKKFLLVLLKEKDFITSFDENFHMKNLEVPQELKDDFNEAAAEYKEKLDQLVDKVIGFLNQ